MNKETTNKYGFRSCHSERGQKPSVGIFTNQDCRVALRIAPRNDGKRETRDKYLNQKGFAPILLILFFIILGAGLGAGVYLVQKTQIFKPKAAAPSSNTYTTQTPGQVPAVKSDSQKALEDLNKQLIIGVAQYSSVKASSDTNTKEQTLTVKIPDSANAPTEEILKKRKDLILKMAETSPQEVLSNTIPKKFRDSLPQKLQVLVEEEVEIKGVLSVRHEDDFKNRTSTTTYSLTDAKDRKTIYKIYFLSPPSLRQSGSMVSLKGIRIDNTVITGQIDTKGAQVQGISTALGKHKILAILFNISTGRGGITVQDFKEVLDKVNEYYRENSYGKTWFEFDILEITKSRDTTPNCSVDELIQDLGITRETLSRYEAVLVSRVDSTLGSTCGNNRDQQQIELVGEGSVTKTIVNVNVGSTKSGQMSSLGYYGHELGHFLGVFHDYSLGCPKGVSISYRGCQAWERGDVWTVMGASPHAAMHMTAPQKEYLGWFSPLQVTTVSHNGTYTIEPISTQSNGLKVLKIPRGYNDFWDIRNGKEVLLVGEFPADYLYIEYKQPIGWDSGMVGNSWQGDVYDGIRLMTISSNAADSVGEFSDLLDTTPDEDSTTDNTMPPNVLNTTLHAGKTFIDPATGTRVTLKEKNIDKAIVEITLGSRTDFNPPDVAITSPNNSDKVSGVVNVSASASDKETGISKVEFYDATDYWARKLIGTSNQPPYKVAWDTTNIQLRDSSGLNVIQAKVYDNSGSSFNWPGNTALSALNYIDTRSGTNFLIRLASPFHNSIVKSPVTFTATSSDGSALVGVSYLICKGKNLFNDCVWKQSSTTVAPYAVDVDLPLGIYSAAAAATKSGFQNYMSPPSVFTVSDTLPSPSPSVSPSPSPTPTSTPAVGGVYTTHYRYTDDLTVFNGTVADVDARLPWIEYTSDPMVVNKTFSSTLGSKSIWVEFKDSTGKIERRTLAFNLSSPVPSPSPSASVVPTPTPSATPVPPNPGGGGGGGGGAFTPQVVKRTIKYVKYGEDPSSLISEQPVVYYPGDSLPYGFKKDPEIVNGKKTYFLFVRFEDANHQVFKINGQDYITQSITYGSEETPVVNQPAGGGTPPKQQTSTSNTESQVVIGTASLSTSQSVSIGSPVSINLSISGFSTPGRSIVGLFVRNQTGTCSISDCGYNGWTQIRSYGSNGTDTNSYTDTSNLVPGIHMFAVFSLNADGTAGQLLAVSPTDFGGDGSSITNTPSNPVTNQCQPRVTECSCGGTLADGGKDTRDPGKCYPECNGGWCEGNPSSKLGGICASCQP